MRILLVEDEAAIARAIAEGLEEDGHRVDVAHDGVAGLRLARENTFALIVLDLMLPKMDGWSVCAQLRSEQDTTLILMLTARDTVADRVRGLTQGADDYLTKPFDIRELRARVQALLRRGVVNKAPIIRVADLVIDTSTQSVTRAGKKVTLTGREFSLLEALARNQGRIVTRETIVERVWMDETLSFNAVDVYIRMLRKKLNDDSGVKLIHTIHGSGYSLRLPNGEEST